MKTRALFLALTASLALAQPEPENPFKNDPQAVEAGRASFRTYCTGCHGMHAQGGRGPDLTRGTFSVGNRDRDLFTTISKGIRRTEMSSFATVLGEEGIWRVISYIRSTTGAEREKAKGDPASGEKLFWGKGGCGSCHRVGERGGTLGPDLTSAGKSRTLEYLRDSVISPNADVTPGYATITVVTRDGKKFVGVQRHYDNLSAELVDAQGIHHSFEKSQVASMSRDFISVMPGNYAKVFTPAELDDLIAYLSQLGVKSVALGRRIETALFVPDPPPALAPVSYGSFEPTPGVVAERISYGTEFGMRIPAILYRPAKPSAQKAPGIVVVNGHGGDKYAWYSFYTGMLYAKAGAFVITYDPIGEGERNAERKSTTRQHDISVPPEEMGRRMAGLMITDVRQAVSYLAQRPEVDPSRIAAAGYSMGSFVLGVTCALETRLHACVLVGGGNLDGPGGYWDRSNHTMCQAIPYKSLMFLGDRGAVLYDLHARRGGTFIFNGTADGVVTSEPEGPQAFFEDLRKRTIALHASDHNVFEFGFEPGAGHRPYFVTRPVAMWLERQLRFPNWTEAEIAGMPETHIGEWAKREHVYIEPAYATEVREAGVRALGKGIPGVAREQLDAVPLDQWKRDKNLFVYESWIAKAKELAH